MAKKGRFFSFLVYPESVREDWMDALREMHGAFAISPLHDQEGKSHYHVIYRHDGPTTAAHVLSLMPDDVVANDYVDMVASASGYERYLCHLDDADKQQWDGDPYELITCLGGYQLDLTRDLTKREQREALRVALEIICEQDITEYSDLVDWLRYWHDDLDVFTYVVSHTVFFTSYLTSKRYKVSIASRQANL